jgi:hypothetical protein
MDALMCSVSAWAYNEMRRVISSTMWHALESTASSTVINKMQARMCDMIYIMHWRT